MVKEIYEFSFYWSPVRGTGT